MCGIARFMSLILQSLYRCIWSSNWFVYDSVQGSSSASTMQSDREKVREESRAAGRQLDTFDNIGFHGSMFPSIFGGKDPFDDPFFSRPHGALFGSHKISSGNPGNVQPMSRSKGLVIEELDSDAEDEENDVRSPSWENNNPLVEHPDDQDDDYGKSPRKQRDVSSSANQIKVEPEKPRSHSVSFQKVTYGGINGSYYTATTSRRTGSDGVTWEESKQADRTTGQAAHKVSRGIHDKGHSVTRKLGSDGKVESVQTLQNLNEDELDSFEKAWGGNHFRGRNDSFDFPNISGMHSNRLGPLAAWGSLSDPLRELSHTNRLRSFNQEQPTRGRPKKVVTINIE
ncbi:uncharacterized protein LOC121794302 [Salvia splendens]|uniref:uncharacterized protein LOC121794302 n=1 Tax=Salvia splendens TaxID=180675 RepID=UPI001C27538B|nr:uncharacterized protein LOC121794302 [Salvia splendens]